MPQMAPIWWTLIMTSTIIAMLIMMTITYFSSNKMINKSIKNWTKKEINWKW